VEHLSVEDWFALTVKPRHDKAVASGLQAKGFETLLPTCKIRHRYATRLKEWELPLFPGYVFCRFNPRVRLPILTTPGVVGVVGAGPNPVPIDEGELDSLRRAIRSHAQLQPVPFLPAGQKVRIERGAFTGIEGIVVRVKSSPALVISITLLQRSVLLEIEPDFVTPERAVDSLAVGKTTCR
jgi:transcription antitermination factor NusG